MANKVWKKPPPVYYCGNCAYCGKEHLSNEGGWIINAEKLNFCHQGDDGCFDMYIKLSVEMNHGTTWNHGNKSWKERQPYKKYYQEQIRSISTPVLHPKEKV